MEMKLTSINFFRRVAEGSRSFWLQTLGNQLIHCSQYILTTNITYHILFLEYTNKPQMNTCIALDHMLTTILNKIKCGTSTFAQSVFNYRYNINRTHS